MNCKQCGKEIDLKKDLKLIVDALTVKGATEEIEELRMRFLASLKKDLGLIIDEKNEELRAVCSNACYNKLLYNEYLIRLENKEIGFEFYEEKIKYTKKLIEDYN